MSPRPIDNEISKAVAAYCEAIDVPSFDEAAIASFHRVRVDPIAPRRPTRAAYVAVMAALLAICGTIPAVVAEVHQVFAAFTVDADRRAVPILVRAVALQQARADVPFHVIAPPSIVGARVVAVDEASAGGSPSEASIIFEIHGTAPGSEGMSEGMIVESEARHAPTLFALRGPTSAAVSSRSVSREAQTWPAHRTASVMLREAYDGRTFAPASWVAHGTRVVVLSPPGFLSIAQVRAIERAMSR